MYSVYKARKNAPVGMHADHSSGCLKGLILDVRTWSVFKVLVCGARTGRTLCHVERSIGIRAGK